MKYFSTGIFQLFGVLHAAGGGMGGIVGGDLTARRADGTGLMPHGDP